MNFLNQGFFCHNDKTTKLIEKEGGPLKLREEKLFAHAAFQKRKGDKELFELTHYLLSLLNSLP